jgi:hypothetical protein
MKKNIYIRHTHIHLLVLTILNIRHHHLFFDPFVEYKQVVALVEVDNKVVVHRVVDNIAPLDLNLEKEVAHNIEVVAEDIPFVVVPF